MTTRLRTAAPAATLTLLFLLFSSPAALSAQQGQMPITASKEALALFLQGRAKLDNLEDPGTLFEQAIQKDPNFALAYLFAGRTSQETWVNLEKAAGLADKASPGEREWILAAKAQAEGDAAKRKEHLDRLLALHPKDARAHEQMGYYYRSIGDNATALKHFTDAANLDKSFASSYNNVGYANISLGRYAEAEQAFKTYIKLIPKNPNPYDSYAELLMKQGRYDESIVQYSKAVSLDPKFANAYGGVGYNHLFKGDYVKAREAFQRMYDSAPDDNWRDQALVSLANSYISEGKVDEALKVNERRREMAEKAKDIPQLMGVHGTAGFILAEARRVDEAAKHFDAADKLREDPSLPAAVRENTRFGGMQNRARLLIARGEFDAARKQLEELGRFVAGRKNPNQERGYNATLGLLELKQKNYAKALEHFAKASPDDPYVMYHTAAAYEGMGDKKKAEEAYRKVANWNQGGNVGYAVVRPRAVSKMGELAKTSK